VTESTIAGLAGQIRAGRLSPVEVTRECLARIDRLDGRLRTFITLDAEGALRAAGILEAEARAGRWRGPLHGVPLAYKDLCHIPGLPTSCGTRFPSYFVGAGEATVVSRLAAAGAITLGKLNMTELATGPFGDNAHHGDAQNPWKPGHCAGGSSSGSGAGVAARLFPGALGTDTGGSIRLPAACCGIVGLKPTYGRVSRAGIMPLAWSMDHVGPMTLTVRDAAILLGVMAGADPADATASRRPVPDYAGALARGRIEGLRIGVPENYFFDGVEAEMAAAVRAAAREMDKLGARVTGIRLPDPGAMNDLSTIVSRAESAAVHGRLLREHPGEMQAVVRRRIEIGLAIPAHDYLQALRLRAHLTREFVRAVFGEVDVLMAPVIPEPAPALPAVTSGDVEEIVARMGRFSRLTRPWNGLGLPALALPCGFAGSGLPLALQLIGRPFAEATVLRAGHAWEEACGGWTRRPPLD
jgi:aspartyl-tRNA(Asn)/glutamyl-tRNA(Gln) amidotransferase subunit A